LSHTYQQEDLEKACLEEAKTCFTQAAQTPMLQSLMVDLIGLDDMDVLAFQQILDGHLNAQR